jgi:Tfp pilus assembly protein PilE
MAGSKLIISGKVNGSTIIEVLISMVVIMVVFGIAMMIYANIIPSSLSNKKLKAEALLSETLVNDEKLGNNTSLSFTVGEIRIEQQVQDYNSNQNLQEIDLTAYDAGEKKVAELHKVIIKK